MSVLIEKTTLDTKLATLEKKIVSLEERLKKLESHLNIQRFPTNNDASRRISEAMDDHTCIVC